jgi:two-component system sensor histidine kinase UhpB
VADDGAGFNLVAASEGIGIIGMRERVHALQGTMAVHAAPGQGAEVAIVLPLDLPSAVS